MKLYNIAFTGREVGAIGKTYLIQRMVRADSKKKAVKKLYENMPNGQSFEHIRVNNIFEIV